MFTDSQSQTRLKQLSMHAGTAKIRQDRPVVGVLIPHCAPANYSKQDETNTYICDKKVLLLYYPIGRRKLSASGQPTVAAQPTRSLYTLVAQLLPMDSLVITAPPNSTLFPIEARTPSSFSGFASDPP